MKLWKVQKFFGDVVYDLRSRGLLPVVILLLVAMVAVPVLISRGGSDSSTPSLQQSAAAPSTPETESAVVSYNPGVRNYHKRLDDLSPKNPFRRQVDQAAAAASKLTVTNTAAPASSSSSGNAGTATTGDTTSSGSTGTTTATHHLYLYHAVADISVGEVTQPLVRHKHIKAFSALPNQITPVMIYLGSSLDEKRAYFSISKNANLVPGESTCVPSPTDCSLLALSRGQSADMVYSVDGKTYRVKVNNIELKRTAADQRFTK